jgi:hypothetical protein
MYATEASYCARQKHFQILKGRALNIEKGNTEGTNYILTDTLKTITPV